MVVTKTNSDGSVTTTNSIAGVVNQTANSKPGGTNTGAIVGGVVGGVGGLIVLAALLFFLLRKRRRSHRDDFDDMMFDPNRTQNHAQVDLADPGERTVEPFYAPGVASTAANSPEMAQYPRSATTTSDAAFEAQGLSRGASSATSAGFAGRGAGAAPQGMAFPTPNPALPPIPTGVATGATAGITGGAMSAKQREAYQEQQRLRVANQGEAGYSGSAEPTSPTGTNRSGPVTVHEDARAAEEEDIGPSLGAEIPPTYDSIRK